ncbi:MAG TPA: (2Fe-2S)-binding protein [Solirubrobacter sp.]|jgi:carbon-monoxide dehydrogenase small subunit|nr:(2Fe-2S)-binding protein [Solirubrobacter sp.]
MSATSQHTVSVSFTLNGEPRTAEVETHRLLLDVLREDFGLTGAKRSCDVEVCGTCTVLVDDEAVSSCTMLAADVQGRSVLTIEGLASPDGTLHPVQQAFLEHRALQCGFCTPGFVLSVVDLAGRGPVTREELVHHLDGNICRCTGYEPIIEAALDCVEIIDREDSE